MKWPLQPFDVPVVALLCSGESFSVARSTRRLLVLSQAREQLTEAFLARTRCSTLAALATDVHQLGNAIPARAARDSVLPVSQELLGLLSSLRNALLLLVVVVLVEVVDVLLSFLDCVFSLGRVLLGSLRDLPIPALPPLLDDIRFLLISGGCLVARVVVDRRSSDRAAAWTASTLQDDKSAIGMFSRCSHTHG